MKTNYFGALKKMFPSELCFVYFFLLIIIFIYVCTGMTNRKNGILKCKIKIIIPSIQNSIWHLTVISGR